MADPNFRLLPRSQTEDQRTRSSELRLYGAEEIVQSEVIHASERNRCTFLNRNPAVEDWHEATKVECAHIACAPEYLASRGIGETLISSASS